MAEDVNWDGVVGGVRPPTDGSTWATTEQPVGISEGEDWELWPSALVAFAPDTVVRRRAMLVSVHDGDTIWCNVRWRKGLYELISVRLVDVFACETDRGTAAERSRGMQQAAALRGFLGSRTPIAIEFVTNSHGEMVRTGDRYVGTVYTAQGSQPDKLISVNAFMVDVVNRTGGPCGSGVK